MSETETVDLYRGAMDMLEATSRTFYIPISRLSPGLQEAVTSAYLCMRAIDEIEDHLQLPSEVKVNLLCSISRILQRPFSDTELMALFYPYKSLLPEVTLRIGEWTKLGPASLVPKICNATATMAKGMADWVSKAWRIKTEEDLNDYTFCVAGLVGILLSDVWMWYDSIETDRNLAVAFGRGLQAVNIIRNRTEDLSRGADFFPDGWELEEMLLYARRNLSLADLYTQAITYRPILEFCKIPLALANGTLDAVVSGKTKLSRDAVAELVGRVTYWR